MKKISKELLKTYYYYDNNIMMDKYQYMSVQAHRKYNTKSEI